MATGTIMFFGKTIMRHTLVLLLFTALMIGVATAKEMGGMEVSVTTGYVLPSSPMAFANYWSAQYGGSLRAGFPLSESVSLIGSLEYYRFTLNETGVKEGFNTDYVKEIWIFDRVTMNPSADPSSVVALSASFRVAPSPRAGLISPYFIAGLGVMQVSMSNISMPVTSVLTINTNTVDMTARNRIVGGKQTALMLQSGLGVDFNISTLLNAFVEARYAIGLTEGHSTSYIPLGVGVKLRL